MKKVMIVLSICLSAFVSPVANANQSDIDSNLASAEEAALKELVPLLSSSGKDAYQRAHVLESLLAQIGGEKTINTLLPFLVDEIDSRGSKQITRLLIKITTPSISHLFIEELKGTPVPQGQNFSPEKTQRIIGLL